MKINASRSMRMDPAVSHGVWPGVPASIGRRVLQGLFLLCSACVNPPPPPPVEPAFRDAASPRSPVPCCHAVTPKSVCMQVGVCVRAARDTDLCGAVMAISSFAVAHHMQSNNWGELHAGHNVAIMVGEPVS